VFHPLKTLEKKKQICIYRMKLNAPGEGAAKKRKEAGGKPAGKEYEYVNVHLLYTALRSATLQCVGRVHMPTLVGHEMAMLTCLIALTGTDFSRGLPQVPFFRSVCVLVVWDDMKKHVSRRSRVFFQPFRWTSETT